MDGTTGKVKLGKVGIEVTHVKSPMREKVAFAGFATHLP